MMHNKFKVDIIIMLKVDYSLMKLIICVLKLEIMFCSEILTLFYKTLTTKNLIFINSFDKYI